VRDTVSKAPSSPASRGRPSRQRCRIRSAKGRFEIISGTGAYAGIQGGGTVVVVADALSNQVIGTEEGSVDQ